MAALMETPAKRLRTEDPESSAKAANTELQISSAIEVSLFGDSQDGSDVSGSDDAGSLPSDAESDDYDMFARRWTPNQLRAKIRTLLQKTDIKTTEFQKMLSVNSNSYNRFMNNKYKDQLNATSNSTYDAATRFFLKEERLGKNALG